MAGAICSEIVQSAETANSRGFLGTWMQHDPGCLGSVVFPPGDMVPCTQIRLRT